jgi:hypothetical protein
LFAHAALPPSAVLDVGGAAVAEGGAVELCGWACSEDAAGDGAGLFPHLRGVFFGGESKSSRNRCTRAESSIFYANNIRTPSPYGLGSFRWSTVGCTLQ